MRFLFLLFILVPLLEMFVLIKVGQSIGALSTIGLVVLTAAIGIAMLKRQGLATLSRANLRINAGELPAQEMLEGIVLAVGGALLLTPGFITDAFGFACLLPQSRKFFIRQLLKNMQVVSMSRYSHFSHSGMQDMHRQAGQQGAGDVIEGEYQRKD